MGGVGYLSGGSRAGSGRNPRPFFLTSGRFIGRTALTFTRAMKFTIIYIVFLLLVIAGLILLIVFAILGLKDGNATAAGWVLIGSAARGLIDDVESRLDRLREKEMEG